MRTNNLMSDQSKRRPLGVTLLGYLLLISAVFQGIALFQGKVEFATFLGFLAPTPLPQIEYGVELLLYIGVGIGLLKMLPWARITFIVMLGISIATTIIGFVTTLSAHRHEQQLGEMFPGQVESTVGPAWFVQLVVAVGILAAVLIYMLRRKDEFTGPPTVDVDCEADSQSS